jgi:mannan polymerase II complex MNN10 subunit
MSLSRSPSPRPDGGWSTPGLTDQPGHDSPRKIPYEMNGYASNDISWAAAKAKSDQFKGYPSFSTRNEGFFSRSKRKISSTLPRFNSFGATGKDWRESEKLGRGRWYPGAGGRWPKLKTFIGNVLRKFRFLLIVLAIIAFITFVASKARECSRSRQQNSGDADQTCRNPNKVSQKCPFWGWKQVCNHPGCEPRRWCYGLERTP